VAERDELIHIMACDTLAYERGRADGRREERRAVCAQAVARAGPDEASPRRRVLVSFAKDVFADGVDDNLPPPLPPDAARAEAARLGAENGRLREALQRIIGEGEAPNDDATMIAREALGESPPSP
jgi:hypothetical protein